MIADINEVIATIATAVEEQSVSTNEISSNVNQAAQGSQAIKKPQIRKIAVWIEDEEAGVIVVKETACKPLKR